MAASENGVYHYTGMPLNCYFSNDSNPMDLGIHEFQTKCHIQLGIVFASQFGELVGQFVTKSHGF